MSDDEDTDSDRVMWPFLAAAAVAAIVVVAVVLSWFLTDHSKSDAQQIKEVTLAFTAARNSHDHAEFAQTTCPGYSNPELEKQTGRLTVSRVGAAVVDGEHATAEVTSQFDGKPEAKVNWTYRRVDGHWRVCGQDQGK